MKPLIYVLISSLLIISHEIYAQVNHWESVVVENDNWKYIVPSSDINNWQDAGFDDTGWTLGVSAIGYGEPNILTTINAGSVSVYLRHKFTINNLNEIEDVLLHMDYDDGFVAYLNGNEVVRSLVSGTPTFDQLSDGLHESLLYQSVAPEAFYIDKSYLQSGNNVLAVEVHNQGSGSSDLMAHPILSVGINHSGQVYSPAPSWFVEPFNFTSSDLPIITIDTQGAPIQDDPKVRAAFKIYYDKNGGRNSINDVPSFDWFCGIEIRGESSQGFEKKSYGFEMWDALGNDIDTTFLNFPSEEDFILYGPFSDKTQMNNVMTMHFGNKMGRYASRTRYVELLVNDDYKGLYVLMEKIKRDDNRVDISKLNPDEISGDDLTGGYIVRIDKGNYNGWYSQYGAYGNQGNNIYFQYFYPDQVDIHPAQGTYIKSYFDEFEKAIASPSYKNNLGVRYTEYINLRSFVDTFILNELAKNVDGYRLSTYFHKQKDSKGGKLFSGPLWDFNLAFGNGNYCGGDDVTGWEYYQCVGSSPFWWDTMLQDTLFSNALKCRWEKLRTTLLATPMMEEVIDSLAVIIDEAQGRNFQRWPYLGTYLWPNPPYFYQNITSHAQIISAMKTWLFARAEWMDANMPGKARYCYIYEEIPRNGPLEIYPNPASDYVKFKTDLIVYGVQLLDVSGRKLGNLPYSNDTQQLNFPTGIREGFYFLIIQTNQGLKMRKVLINGNR